MPNIETTDLLSQNQRYLLRLLTYSKLFIKANRGDRGFLHTDFIKITQQGTSRYKMKMMPAYIWPERF